ncbi:hypothetical protein WME99_30080 [Sorangium sp. So ce136]|uniref:hypothetical protein n=1 Tax=Sorangium sp. So ce136 TaxID=3133284 RepID=UPI003EFED30F
MKAMMWMAVALALHGLGCVAAQQKMDPSRPIELHTGFFAARYKQDGKPISDVPEWLAKEPEAAPYVSRSQALTVLAGLVAGAGGGLIGWPVGEALGGERDPVWPLAGAGAVAIALTIPLAIWSVSNMDSAAEAHNRLLLQGSEWSAAPKREAAPAERAGPVAPPARLEAFGFVFGATRPTSLAACQKAGHTWSEEEDGVARCSGTPTESIAGASAELTFEDERLSAVEVVIRPPEDAQGWATSFRATEAALIRIFGKSAQRSFVIPDECKAAELFLGCVADGRVTGSASWSLDGGPSVVLSIIGSPPPSTLRVRLTPALPKM